MLWSVLTGREARENVTALWEKIGPMQCIEKEGLLYSFLLSLCPLLDLTFFIDIPTEGKSCYSRPPILTLSVDRAIIP